MYDLPSQTVQRYQKDHTPAKFTIWNPNHKVRTLSKALDLRIEVLAPVTVVWTDDAWQSKHTSEVIDTGLGEYYLDLPSRDLPVDGQVEFTFYYPAEDRWEGRNYQVKVTQ